MNGVERRLGEMLAETVQRGNPQWSHDGTIRLRDLNVTKKESARWQKEASVPEEDFERYLAEAAESGVHGAAQGREAVENRCHKGTSFPPRP